MSSVIYVWSLSLGKEEEEEEREEGRGGGSVKEYYEFINGDIMMNFESLTRNISCKWEKNPIKRDWKRFNNYKIKENKIENVCKPGDCIWI